MATGSHAQTAQELEQQRQDVLKRIQKQKQERAKEEGAAEKKERDAQGEAERREVEQQRKREKAEAEREKKEAEKRREAERKEVEQQRKREKAEAEREKKEAEKRREAERKEAQQQRAREKQEAEREKKEAERDQKERRKGRAERRRERGEDDQRGERRRGRADDDTREGRRERADEETREERQERRETRRERRQERGERGERREGGLDRRERRRLARELRQDDRDAERLEIVVLRGRVQDYRSVLAEDGLPPRLRRDMRERLDRDRRILRRRIAERRDPDNSDRVRDRFDGRDPDRGKIREFVSDRRPSSELGTGRLRARSRAFSYLLEERDLPPRRRANLARRLEDDRRELRLRLRDQRQERRRKRRDQITRRERFLPHVDDYVARDSVAAAEVTRDIIVKQLLAPPVYDVEPRYSIAEVKQQREVRDAMPSIDVDTINFGFNEFTIRPEEVESLDTIGLAIEDILSERPDEVFLLGGHTDAVGNPDYNLDLSDKRAEAVRQALLDYYQIEPRNLETEGYGERYLKIETPEAEEENRRVTVQRITPLIR